VRESDDLAGGNESREEHDCCLAILAYQYVMLLWLATYVEKEHKAEADEILKELRWLLNYGRGRKYPVIRTLMSVIGAENTGRLLNFYRLHK